MSESIGNFLFNFISVGMVIVLFAIPVILYLCKAKEQNFRSRSRDALKTLAEKYNLRTLLKDDWEYSALKDLVKGSRIRRINPDYSGFIGHAFTKDDDIKIYVMEIEAKRPGGQDEFFVFSYHFNNSVPVELSINPRIKTQDLNTFKNEVKFDKAKGVLSNLLEVKSFTPLEGKLAIGSKIQDLLIKHGSSASLEIDRIDYILMLADKKGFYIITERNTNIKYLAEIYEFGLKISNLLQEKDSIKLVS